LIIDLSTVQNNFNRLCATEENQMASMDIVKKLVYKTSPWLYNRVREVKFFRDIKGFQPKLIERRYGDHSFKVNIKDPLAEGWYDHDWEPLRELEILSEHGLQPGATVFDLGAHQNIVAMMLAARVGATGKVVAVEGSRHNAEIGRENAAANGFTNVTTLHAVAADTVGELAFSSSLNGHVSLAAGDFRQETVRAITIDSLAEEYGTPDVVFVDIEGHEMAALRGATRTLQARPAWFIELHGDEILAPYGAKNADVLDAFDEGWRFLCRPDEVSAFMPITEAREIPSCRSFLIAISTV
jgi:FkbM family methyltransferase